MNSGRLKLVCTCALPMVLVLLNSSGSFAWIQQHGSRIRHLKVAPLSTEDEPKTETGSASSASSVPLLDWNASGSIGSLLMQMQKKEEELRRLNQTLLSEDEAVELDPSKTSEEDKKTSVKDTKSPPTLPLEEQSELDPMDADGAKDLDKSVVYTTRRSVGTDVEVLNLPDLYAQLAASKNQSTSTSAASSLPLPPLSRPTHYKERIGRDMRYLGVSIASSVQDVDEWREFCQQPHRSGIIPLVESIQEGARSIRNRKEETLRVSDYVQTQYEESFVAASSACRALRDLCALSPEAASVITDCLLRANTACAREGKSLMDDFCTLLKYAHDNTEYDYKRSRFWRRKKAKWTISGWKKRRGECGVSLISKYNTYYLNLPCLAFANLQFIISSTEARYRCQLYVMQLLLATTVASDSAVTALRSTKGLKDVVLKCSSYDRKEQTRRWLRYPGEVVKQKLSIRKKKKNGDESPQDDERRTTPFIEAASPRSDIIGKVQGTANQILAAMGYNQWVPKSPNQKGLRILCLDGGGSRGMVAVTAVDCLVKELGTGR
jgi:hypothetical protein